MKKLLLIIVLIAPIVVQARNPIVDAILERNKIKSKAQWTIADWFSTKKTISDQNMWLALNSSTSLFEFYFYGDLVQDYENEVVGSLTMPIEGDMSTYGLGVFMSIFGLEAQKRTVSEVESDIDRLMLTTRVFGKSDQSGNLNLHFGIRSVDDQLFGTETKNQFYGASLKIYILSFLGVRGMYQKYLPDNIGPSLDVEGSYTEYGAFLEYSLFHIFANVFRDENSFSNGDKYTIEGTSVGLKLYF